MTEPLRVLSLGGGVQSTTLALMAAAGELETTPAAAIFADTGWEPPEVYEHLRLLAERLPFPVHVVTAGNILEGIYALENTTGGRYAAIPWFVLNPDGSKGIGRRQCTSEYKLGPIMRKVRELMGVGRRGLLPAGAVEVWIGISTDEAARMKDARQRYMVNRWPLIERGMSRQDCKDWLVANGHVIPHRSACIGCPFHSNAEWRQMRVERPDLFAHACEVDAALREGNARGARREFMHPARVPLADAITLTEVPENQLDLFNMECEGMCGL